MNSCKNACDDETEYLKNIYNKNKPLILKVKTELTKLIFRMERIGVDLNTMLSDAVYTGNIGNENKIELINYLKSNDSTIREKVAGISNTFWDAKLELPQYTNCTIFYEHIMKNKNKKGCKEIYKSIQLITKNSNPETLDSKNNKISVLWCPLFYIFPGYIFKRTNVNLFDKLKEAKTKSMKKKYFIEDMSIHEKVFLIKNNINIENKVMDIEIGQDLYKDSFCKFLTYKKSNYSCRVAGVSGHAILHFILGLILNIDWKYIFVGQLFEMVPAHHSIEEICFALEDIKFFIRDKNIHIELFNKHKDMIDFINKHIIKKITNEKKTLKKIRYYKKRFNGKTKKNR